MTRFAWLQARTQTAVVLVGVAVVAVVAAITGPGLGHTYATTVANCRATGNCPLAVDAFTNHDATLYGILGLLVVVVPGIVGLFWGAPLIARELESGTYRLAWTQSVGRRRWLGTKVAVVGLAGLAATGLLSLTVTWWARSVDLAHANQFRYFEERDIVPIGYAAFALALGVLIGLLVRRVLPAVATTLASFVVVRFAFTRWVRPHLAAAAHRAVGLRDAGGLGFEMGPHGPVFHAEAPNIQNAYVLSAQLTDRGGHAVTTAAVNQFVTQHCPTVVAAMANGPRPGEPTRGVRASGNAFDSCVDRLASAYHSTVAYIAPSKYWTMQWLELAIFLAGALVLLSLAVWLVKRTPS